MKLLSKCAVGAILLTIPAAAHADAFIIDSKGNVIARVKSCVWKDTEDGIEWQVDGGAGMGPLADGYICDGEDVTEGSIASNPLTDPRGPIIDPAREAPRVKDRKGVSLPARP